ncbi:hypothetical protein VTK56DRAFT_4369 [Thermocarpiscus australiensis]
MVSEDGAASKPTPEQSNVEQEKNLAADQTSSSQAEHESEKTSAPPLPPRPPATLPPPHHEALWYQQHPGVPVVPLPVQPPLSPPGFERPFYPGWHKAKLVLGGLSLAVCAVIFGVGIALGLYNAPYSYGFGPASVEFGTSGAAAGLAVLVTTAEFLTQCLSSRRQGIHPGALVAFHLFIWLVAIFAVVVTALYVTDDSSYYYDYPRSHGIELAMQNAIYEQVLLGFDCALLFIHFVLFVGACVETNRLEIARKKTVYIRVPVPAGAPYSGPPYPGFAIPQPFVPQPGAQGVQYAPTMTGQVPRQPGQATGPTSPRPMTLYGGYYAPAPPPMAWTASQHSSAVPFQEYYTPSSTPGMTPVNPAQSARQEPPSATAASSSRSSQGQTSQTQNPPRS